MLFSLCFIGVVYLFTGNRKRMFNQLANLNILSIKLFQAFALNIEDQDLMNELIAYSDSSPFTIEKDVDLVSLYKLKREHHLSFHLRKPINTGMISLVYKATDIHNKEIIIKIKRKNIEERLNHAINEIRKFIIFLSWFQILFPFNILKIEKCFNENIPLIDKQLNFILERENIQKMHCSAKSLDYVVIPKVFEEYCSNNIIVMEFIHGLHITKVPDIHYQTYAEMCVKYILTSLVVSGSVHGDLHCGNILFLEEPNTQTGDHKLKIGIIDFGLVYNINETFKNKLMEVLIDVFTKKSDIAATTLFYSTIMEPMEVIHKVPNFHKEQIIKILSGIIETTLRTDSKGGILDIFKSLYVINDYIKKHDKEHKINLTVNPEFIKVQLIVAMIQGIVITLCKEKHFKVVDECITKLFHLDLLQD